MKKIAFIMIALFGACDIHEEADDRAAISGRVPRVFRIELGDAVVVCETDGNELGCSADIGGQPAGDPLEGAQVCVGNLCVGCNTADDVGSEEFYVMCYACAGNSCIGATCTANGGWHCGSDY